ncbi:MAG: hypothetical protein OK474_01665 [Thaumarchaeota archaeon]|nr:hypothetical protein [Nitrososphaerota archaeon]
MKAKQFLKGIVYERSEIDEWLSGRRFPFSKYDPDIGYLHRDRRCREGVDGSWCTYTYERRTGARTILNNADQKCRINTYGNSYTNCEQVNDGETWQELLAARIGEPIRNFGTGGQSVYQMYLRMRREEEAVPAKYIIMNIYGDDPFRSLAPWQSIRLRSFLVNERSWGSDHTWPPQPYIKANPATKEFREFKNPCPEPKDLYDFCNLDWVYENFKEDFTLRIMLAKSNAENGTPEDSYKDIEDLAEEYGVKRTIRDSKELVETANLLFRDSAIYGAIRLVEKTEDFIRERNKQILFIGSYTSNALADYIDPRDEPRLSAMRRPGHSFNKDFMRFMKKRGDRYVDLIEAHAEDFSRRRVKLSDYLKEFWVFPDQDVTHYAPAGNQFTARITLGNLLRMLEPKPPAYLPALSEKWDTCVSLDQAR